MPIKVETPDGGVAEFPDNTPPTIIEAALRQKFPAPAKAITEPGVGLEGRIALGAAKGIGSTISGLGSMVHAIPGVSRGMDVLLGQPGVSETAFKTAREVTKPEGVAEQVGKAGEQAAEFLLVPGPAKVKGAARALQLAKTGALSAGLAKAQGASAGGAAVTGAVSALPVGPAVEAAATKAVRSVLKPTVAAMRRIAGGSARGIDAKAEQLVSFVIQQGLTTPEKAQNLLAETERELQRVLSVKNAPTDAPTRALRYLDTLEKNAAKAGLGAEKVAALREAAEDTLKGVMGRDVTTMVAGQPMTVRVARPDMTAKEALESARASSRWSTRGTWGPKSTAESVKNVAEKAVEKAQRDAVKAAVPETAALLAKEAQAINAQDVLARAAFREASNSMSGIAGAVEVGTGRLPLLGWASKLLREGQLRGGVRVGQLAKAIQEGNGPAVELALKRLGVAIPAELLAEPAQ